MRNYLRVQASLTALCISVFGGCDECDNVGESWCEGYLRVRCVTGGSTSELQPGVPKGNAIVKKDCRDELATCKEGRTEDDKRVAGCVISDEPCPEGRSAVCVGTRIGSCKELGYPENEDIDCASVDKVCAESGTNSGADCAYFTEPCEKNGSKKRDYEGSDVYYTCQYGVWQWKDNCLDGECSTLDDGGVGCH